MNCHEFATPNGNYVVHVSDGDAGSQLSVFIDDLARRHRELVGGAVWISPVADASDVLKTVVRLGIGTRRLDLDALAPDQRTGVDRFLCTP